MTILTQTIGSGPTRRCDSTCHHAKHERCACICGGRYHGKGDSAVRQLARDWLGEGEQGTTPFLEAAGLAITPIVRDAMNQLPLPLPGGEA